MSLRKKIVLIGVSQLVIVSGVLFALYYRDARDRVRQQFVEKARSITLTAESTREGMGGKWDAGLFTAEQLRAWAEEGDIEKVVDAVPVVTAWRAAMRKSEEGNYEFRVPKFEPRNTKNEPDALEAEAIRKMKAEDLAEYTVLDEERNAIRYFRPVKLTAECMLCHGDPATSLALWGNDEGLDPTGGTMENWKVGEVHGAFEVIQSLDEADAQIAAAMWKGSGVVVLLVLCGSGILFYLVTRSVVRPVKRLVATSRTVAEGDLTSRVEVKSRDEIGQLAQAMNESTDRIHDMVREIETTANKLTDSSTQLSTTAVLLTLGAEETTGQSATVAAAAEELSTNMTGMASATEQMSANVKTVAAAVEEMTASITEVARNAEQAANVADRATQLSETSNVKIASLGEAAEAIGQVIDVIRDLADQTNLLALNATIEAARAGEAGKGFAVVATEVKQLAKQSTEATEDIRRRIEGIQGSSGDAVRAIAEISEVIKQVNDVSRSIASAVEEQSITTKEIARNVSETATASEEVSSSVAQSAIATTEISQNIIQVDSNAKATAKGAGNTETSGRELNASAKGLQTLIGRFKTRSRAFDSTPIKEAHSKWKIRLADMLVGRQELDVSQVVDHRQCDFGKWYFGEGLRRFGDSATFKEIDTWHAQVHQKARGIVELHERGSRQEAVQKLQEFFNLTDRLFELLDRLEAEANA